MVTEIISRFWVVKYKVIGSKNFFMLLFKEWYNQGLSVSSQKVYLMALIHLTCHIMSTWCYRHLVQYFSNSLIIHQAKTKEITAVEEV